MKRNRYARFEAPQGDFYETNPEAVELLLTVETFSEKVWECACGNGSISEVLKRHGYEVLSTDLYDHGYGETGIDFLEADISARDIITNPPYNQAREFIEHSLEILNPRHKAAFFLRLDFLGSKKRKPLFAEYPPARVYVLTGRQACKRNGEQEFKRSAVDHCWYIWEQGFKGEPVIRWL